MISWKTIRIVCMVLLLIPIVHLAYLVSRDALATLDPSPDVWADELAAYGRADRSTTLPVDPVVVLGGRRVKLWHHLEDAISRPLLVRGLGDAIVEDITHNYSALVGYYRPSAVVLLPGNSEFHIRDNKSAEELLAAIQELEAIDASHGVTRQFIVYAPLKTPLHPRDDQEIEKATWLLSEWAATHPRVSLLDANALLTDQDGRPRPEYYLSDGVNLNEWGYLRLAVLLQQALDTQAIATP
jgi:hypothetical protein